MMISKWFLIFAVAFVLVGNTACSRSFVGGAAVGAGGAGAAYEYQNKKALDDLEADLKAGRITQEEYLRRKGEIQKRSIIY